MAIQCGCYMMGDSGDEPFVWSVRGYSSFMALTWSGYWLRPWHLTVLGAYCILQSSMIFAADGNSTRKLMHQFQAKSYSPPFSPFTKLTLRSRFTSYKSAVTRSCSVYVFWTIFESASTPLPYSRRGSRQKCSKQSTYHTNLN